MLDFAARDFMEISHKVGLVLGELRKPLSKNPNVLGNSYGQLLVHAGRLGLNVTTEHLLKLIEELVEHNPVNIKRFQETGELVFSGELTNERNLFHLEAVYSTMLAELGGLLFKAIPRERVSYSGPHWLAGTKLAEKFPTSHRELQRAGSCYALGEPTACVFHSMRANEPCLSALSAHFGLSFAQENWQALIEQIESNVRELGRQKKSQKKLEDEKFFGAAASQLYFIKSAWRNHVAHTRESYSDNEALSVMQHTVQFIESLCLRLSEPEGKPH